MNRDIASNVSLLQAVESDDLQRLKLAAEIQNLAAEQAKNTADTARSISERKKLQAELSDLRKSEWLRNFPATQLTVILGLFTLLFQIVQFRSTSMEGRRASEDMQWRDAVKSVSLRDGPEALTGALNLETFYRSPRYQNNAKKLVVASLPYIDTTLGFDRIFGDLSETVTADEQSLLFETAKNVASRYREIYERMKIPPCIALDLMGGGTMVDDRPSDLCSQKLADINSLTEMREWEVDTVTHGLLKFWHLHGTLPTIHGRQTGFDTCDEYPYQMNLTGIIFQATSEPKPARLANLDFYCARLKDVYLESADLTSAKFTKADLSGANLSHANLERAEFDGSEVQNTNFSAITSCRNSSWKDSDWWNVQNASAELKSYLCKRYPDAKSDSKRAEQFCSDASPDPKVSCG